MRSRACVQRREDREQGVRAAEAARPGDDAATVGYPAEDGTVVNLPEDRKSTRLNSSHANISYAVFCLKKKKNTTKGQRINNKPAPLAWATMTATMRSVPELSLSTHVWSWPASQTNNKWNLSTYHICTL